MSRFSKSFLDELRQRVDVVEVVGRYVQLKKAGKDFTALCPFHEEKSPSFTVSATKQFYHCFGCGAHGDGLNFLVEYAGTPFVEAVEDLARHVGLPLPPKEALSPEAVKREERNADLLALLARAKDVFRGNLRVHKHAVDYMKSRGLQKDAVAQFGLGYAHYDDITKGLADAPTDLLVDAGLLIRNDDSGELYDRFRRRIMYPIHNERGAIIGFGGRVLSDDDSPKYMNSPETPVFQKGEELFGLYFAKQEIRRTRTALAFEGYMDVIMLHQHGDRRAVGVLGTSLTERQVARLFRLGDQVIFCFDGDKAGRNAADRAARIVLTAIEDGKTAKFLTLPDDHDPDSYVREHGIEQWMSVVETNSIPLSAKIVRMLTEERDLSLPEVKVTVAKEAVELLATVKKAPIFAGALKSNIEHLLGMGLDGKPMALGRTRKEVRHAVPVNRSGDVPALRPKADRAQFYQNYALLCGLDMKASEAVPEELIDDFALLISGWFAFAPEDIEARFTLNDSNKFPVLQSVIGSALYGIKERFVLLPKEALDKEVAAVLAAIVRESKRQDAVARTSALFD